MFKRFLLTLVLVSAPAFPAGAEAERAPEYDEQVFLTEEAALKSVFPEADRVGHEVRNISPAEKLRIESRLGWSLNESSVTVHEGYKSGRMLGRAVVAEEIGKFKPITFIVMVLPNGEVDRVEVLTYRETVGAEVRRNRFTRQFRGKTSRDGLRINRDILNVTGATMSVQAMTAGVKKVLVLLDELYPKK